MRVQGGFRGSREGWKDVHNMKAQPEALILLLHKTRSKWVGGSRGFQGGSGGLRHSGKTVKNTKQPEKRSGAVWLGYYAATSRILCRRNYYYHYYDSYYYYDYAYDNYYYYFYFYCYYYYYYYYSYSYSYYY